MARPGQTESDSVPIWLKLSEADAAQMDQVLARPARTRARPVSASALPVWAAARRLSASAQPVLAPAQPA